LLVIAILLRRHRRIADAQRGDLLGEMARAGQVRQGGHRVVARPQRHAR